jgi:hypothetical protein
MYWSAACLVLRAFAPFLTKTMSQPQLNRLYRNIRASRDTLNRTSWAAMKWSSLTDSHSREQSLYWPGYDWDDPGFLYRQGKDSFLRNSQTDSEAQPATYSVRTGLTNHLHLGSSLRMSLLPCMERRSTFTLTFTEIHKNYIWSCSWTLDWLAPHSPKALLRIWKHYTASYLRRQSSS